MHRFNLFFLLLFSLFFTSLAFAQKGSITGKVVNEKTGESLYGIAVIIDGSTRGSVTDFDGVYAIKDLPPGTYTLTVAGIGYVKKSIPDVKVNEGSITTLDIHFADTSAEIPVVNVTFTIRKDRLAAVNMMVKNAPFVASVISAETIKISPDKNSGEVLKRISGATIQDNKYAVIRGLNDRYNNAMMNGSPLPSTEPERKTFAFDLIPSNMLDNIIILKSGTPDLPGDFAGGIIQLNTKDVPDTAFYQLAVSSSYNTLTSFRKMIDSRGGTLDWAGFDNSRQLPGDFPSASGFTKLNTAQSIEEAKKFPNDYAIMSRIAAPNFGIQATFGNSYKLSAKNKLGISFSANYGNGNKLGIADRNWYEQDGHADFSYHDTTATNSVNLGGLFNIGFKHGNNTRFSLKNSYSRNADDQTAHRTGVFYANGFERNSYAYSYTSNSLYLSQFSGEHILPKSEIKIGYNLSYGHAVKDVPNYRNLSYSKHMDNDTEAYSLVIATSPTLQSAKFYSKLTENIYGGNYQVTYPIKFIGENQFMKAGGFHQYRDRVFDSRVLGFAIARVLDFNTDLLILPPAEVFDPKNFGTDGFTIRDITDPTNRYTGKSHLNAGFLMFDNKILKKVRAVWGVRFESYHQIVETGLPGSSITDPVPLIMDTTYNDFLPSVNLTYALTEKSNLRLSGTRTVSRPEFRELVPLAFYDFNSFSIIAGNKSIVRTNITNVDLKYEIYPSPEMTFSVALFYKHFKNPIEIDIDNQSPGTISKTYTNAPGAEDYGVEVDFRESLEMLNPSLKNVIVFGNASYIYSKVDQNENEAVFDDHRPMQGQSPYVANLGLQYRIPKYAVNFSALFNRFGNRIYLVGSTTHSNNSNFADVYEKGRSVIDLQASKTFKKKLEVKLSAADILHQNQLFFQDWNKNGRYDKDSDSLMFDYKLPSLYSFSLSYKF